MIGIGSSPRMFAQIAQPVSVCHQWSITGTPSFGGPDVRVGVEALAAANSVVIDEMSYLASSFASGSALRMARIAVGR